MRVKIELIPKRMDGEYGSTHGLGLQTTPEAFLQRFPGATDQFPQKTPFPPKGRPQDFWNGPDNLSVVDRFQNFRGHPLDKSRYPFSLA